MSLSLPLVFSNVVVEFDGGDFSCSITRAEIISDTPTLTAKTLCGVKQGVGRATEALELEGLQDYFEALSLAAFLKENHGEQGIVTFTWVDPNGHGTAEVEATVTYMKTGFGGTADEIATLSVTLPINGEYDLNVLASS